MVVENVLKHLSYIVKGSYKMERLYSVNGKELKKILLDYSIDSKGNKVTKFKLCKNKEFLEKIGCKKDKISQNTIQSWYKRLENFEPKGEMTDEFIFNYHQNVTKRIPAQISYFGWTKDKKNININETQLSKKVKASIGWGDRKKHFAMLKMNDSNFDIEKYQYVSDSDLKFLVDMFIDSRKYKKLEQILENMIKKGDEKIVDYIL